MSRTSSEECVQLCHLDVGGKYLPRRQIVYGGLNVIESLSCRSFSCGVSLFGISMHVSLQIAMVRTEAEDYT